MPYSNLVWAPADVEGVWIGESREPGPVVAVIGGIHGDELTGIEVVRASREKLAVDCGTVVLMLGNLVAIKRGCRQTDTNLNRQFRALTADEADADPLTLAYEIQRAQALMPILDRCDAALDLHDFTSSRGQSFIITERRGWDTARKIGAPVISSGWSKTEPGATDGYMETQAKVGICYEVGQKRHVRKNTPKGHAIVARFLSAQGLLEETFEPLHKDPLLVKTANAFIRTADRYRLAESFVTFQVLRAGQLIAEHGDDRIYASDGDVIIFPERKPPKNTEAFSIGRIVSD